MKHLVNRLPQWDRFAVAVSELILDTTLRDVGRSFRRAFHNYLSFGGHHLLPRQSSVLPMTLSILIHGGLGGSIVFLRPPAGIGIRGEKGVHRNLIPAEVIMIEAAPTSLSPSLASSFAKNARSSSRFIASLRRKAHLRSPASQPSPEQIQKMNQELLHRKQLLTQKLMAGLMKPTGSAGSSGASGSSGVAAAASATDHGVLFESLKTPQGQAHQPQNIQAVKAFLISQRKLFGICYSQARRVDPVLAGQLQVDLSLSEQSRSPSRATADFKGVGGLPGQKILRECIESSLRALQYPVLSEVTQVRFSLLLAASNPESPTH